METRRRIGQTWFVLLALSSCMEDRGPTWVHPDWQGNVGFATSAIHSQLIWQGPKTALYASIDVAKLVSAQQQLVMVTFREDHPDRRVVEDSLSVRAWHSENGVHHALLLMDDQKHVDDLAARMHGHEPGFLPCGRIIRLGLTQAYDVTWKEAPVYADLFKFDAVASMLELPKADDILSDVKILEDLGTRHHAADNAEQVTATVKSMFETAGSGLENFSVKSFDHAGTVDTKQQSVIATVVGTEEPETIIVMGAHLDSINYASQTNAPGADDDASGVATLAAIIRALAASNASFRRTIEFHAYAAEEVGLQGSRHIADTYAADKKNVMAMMQIDMNSYSQVEGDTTIWLVSNHTHINLRRSLKDLMHTYLDGGFADGTIAGGTSDHEAWAAAGFPTVFPFENPSAFNKNLHTDGDTSDFANNYELSAKFAKLGLAFVSHYAGLTAASAELDDAKASALASYDDNLKLAVINGENGLYQIAVATAAQTVTQIMVCKAQAQGSRRCFAELLPTLETDAISERRVFLAQSAIDLSSADRLVVFGYDETDKVVAQRTVKLTKK